MNSTKKLAVLGLMFFFILLQQITKAQLPNINYSPGAFHITVPPIKPQQMPLPYYTTFLETGNGRYRMDTIPDGYTIPTKNIPYLNFISADSNVVLTISSYYDTIRRPPRNIAAHLSNTGGTNPLPQVSLATNEFIRLTPCVLTVVPGDTMVTSITYKPDMLAKNGSNPPGYYIVAFFYNNANKGVAINVFDAVTENTLFNFYDQAQFNSRKIKAIRTHNNEEVKTLVEEFQNLGGNHTLISALSSAKTGYANAIYFKLPSNTTQEERNIFISMAPLNVLTPLSTTPFKATIIKYNESSVINQKDVTMNLGVSAMARDPNGIVTFPQCLDSFSSPYNKPIVHEINFQNDGTGKAKDVIITLWVPKGIKFTANNLAITSIVGGMKKQFINVLSSDNKIPNSYMINKNERTITFKMTGIGLLGTRDAPTDVVKRHGAITFTMRTEKLPEGRDVTQSEIIPNCLYSDIKIVFTNQETRGSGVKNPPIFKHALTRKNCSHVSPIDPCPRLALTKKIYTQ